MGKLSIRFPAIFSLSWSSHDSYYGTIYTIYAITSLLKRQSKRVYREFNNNASSSQLEGKAAFHDSFTSSYPGFHSLKLPARPVRNDSQEWQRFHCNAITTSTEGKTKLICNFYSTLLYFTLSLSRSDKQLRMHFHSHPCLTTAVAFVKLKLIQNVPIFQTNILRFLLDEKTNLVCNFYSYLFILSSFEYALIKEIIHTSPQKFNSFNRVLSVNNFS